MKTVLLLPFFYLLLCLAPGNWLAAQCFSSAALGRVCLETEFENTGCIFLGNPTVSLDDEANTLDWLRNRKAAEFQASLNKTYQMSVTLTSMPLATNQLLGDVRLLAGNQVLATAELVQTAQGATVGNFRVDFEVSFSDLHLVAEDNFALPIYIEFLSFVGAERVHYLSFPLVISGAKLVNNGEILGYTQAPAIPYMILHKPPGDQSSITFSESNQTCFGFSMSTNAEVRAGVDASIKVGAKVQTGFIVSAESEVYAEATASLSMGIGREANNETTYCITTENSYTASGDDVFMMMAPNYAIGLADVIEVDCGSASLKRQITLAREGTERLQLVSKSRITDELIPELEEEIANSTDDIIREKKQAQLDVYLKSLGLAASANLYATDPLSLREENGAPPEDNEIEVEGTITENTITQESSSSRVETINTTFFMDSEVAIRAGFEVAGSGAEVGVSVGLSMGGSNGTTTTSEQTNSISYTLKDDTAGDILNVGIATDPVFGTPVFRLLPGSETSCPYEGGARRFKPRLRVNDRSSAVITGADQAGHEISVQVCNFSETNEARSYLLQALQTNGASITMGDGQILTTGQTNEGGSTGLIQAGDCNNIDIIIRPNRTDEAYEDIRIVQVGECTSGAEDDRSEINVSIYFGDARAVANDNPCQAILLPVDGSVWEGTTEGATVLPGEEEIVADIPFSSNLTELDEIEGWPSTTIFTTVWYKFVAPASGEVDISTCELAGTQSPRFAVYSVADDCGDFANYTLEKAYTMLGNRDCGNLGIVSDLTPGDTYYILVSGESEPNNDFGIRIQEGEVTDLDLTFRVDLTGQTLTSGELYLYGDFARLAGFDTGAGSPTTALMPMTDADGDNVYEITVSLENMPKSGRRFEYIYVDGQPNPGFNFEDRSGSCFTGGIFTRSREFVTSSNGSTTQVINDCYGSCGCSLSFTPSCDNWNDVGAEGDELNLTTEKLLRYGRPGNYAYGTFIGPVTCDNSLFPEVSANPNNACALCQGDQTPDLSSGNGRGLLGVYYNGINFDDRAFSRIDPTIDFAWENTPPGTSIGADNYSVRWTGEVEAGFTETYTFYTTTDDGVRLWVNDVLLIDQWIPQAPTEYSGSIALVAGQRVAIRMEYYEDLGGATAKLSWSSDRVAKQIIPRGNLFPTEEMLMECPNPALAFDGQDDFVNLGTETGNFGNSDFTIELMVNTTEDFSGATYSHVPLAGKRPGCSCESNFWYWGLDQDGTVFMEAQQNNCQTGGLLKSTSLINDGQWHQLAFTRSQDVLSLYVDGILEASVIVPNLVFDLTNNAPLQLGRSECITAGFGGPFSGQMDEFRLWTKARSLAEIQAAYQRELLGDEPSLVAYYPFNDGSPEMDNQDRNASRDLSPRNGLARLLNFERIGNSSNWVTGDNGLSQLDRNQNAVYDACEVTPPIFTTSASSPSLVGVALGQNYPNPTTGETIIPLTVPRQYKNVQLLLISAYGRTVKTFVLRPDSRESIKLNTYDLPAGIYFYSLVVDNHLAGTRRMVIVH